MSAAEFLYHDRQAGSYDEKWGSALELGCGTGFFLLNLKRLRALDSSLLAKVVPAGLLYDVEITGIKPA